MACSLAWKSGRVHVSQLLRALSHEVPTVAAGLQDSVRQRAPGRREGALVEAEAHGGEALLPAALLHVREGAPSERGSRAALDEHGGADGRGHIKVFRDQAVRGAPRIPLGSAHDDGMGAGTWHQGEQVVAALGAAGPEARSLLLVR